MNAPDSPPNDAGSRLLLLLARPPQLLALSLSDGSVETLVADCGGTPDGIAVDAARGYIYWTNMGDDFGRNDGYVERIALDGSGRTVLVEPGRTFTPKQLIVDTEDDFLYWCDREGMRVMRSRTDGSDVTVLVQTGSSAADRADAARHCVGIAIDKAGGYLYWTQKGGDNAGVGRILRAGLRLSGEVDPARRADVEVLFSHLPEPIDLEWDAAENYLYWTDRGDPPLGNTLNRARLRSGTIGEREILLSNLHEGIGLALDRQRGRAFVSDLAGEVRCVDLQAPGRSDVIFAGRGPLTGIALQRPPSADTARDAPVNGPMGP